MGGKKAPAAPAPPKPQYRADDGTIFEDIGAFNSYQTQLKRTRFDTDLTAAMENARNTGRQAIMNRGLNPDDFMSIVENEITNTRKGIPDLAANVGSYFSTNLGEMALNQEQNNRRNKYTNEVQSRFAPAFETKTFADTSDDAVIEALYGEQYNPALDTLNRARGRGVLDEAGYTYATNALNQQGEAAKATLQGLGGGVLSGYRTKLRDVGDTARNAASGYELGQQFDLGTYSSQADDLTKSLQGSMAGDLRNALGSKQLFNIDELITKAGSFQGAGNTQGGLLDQMAEKKKKEEQSRGLGNTGSF